MKSTSHLVMVVKVHMFHVMILDEYNFKKVTAIDSMYLELSLGSLT